MSNLLPDSLFWKTKLLAFLHDPPDKCFNIAAHEALASAYQSAAGFHDPVERENLGNSIKSSDHDAAAADRFVFPQRKCATHFTGLPGASFIHPLGSVPFVASEDLRPLAGHLQEILQSAITGIETDDGRQRFFLYWRRWLENAATADCLHAAQLAFLPADTRIPDHTIWNHMAVTSAFAGATANGSAPALLLFQLGPVQDFIAQARSTLDLWSGSYLLSWLMAHAMKAITDQVGPDALIFPSLRGNGIFDALHRTEMYAARYRDRDGATSTLWERMLEEKGDQAATWLLTPTLPNRFLALVPAERAEVLAKAAEEAIRSELTAIGEAVWRWVAKEGGDRSAGWKSRWDAQLRAFPQTAWATQPWLSREACMAAFKALPVNQEESNTTPLSRLQELLDLGEQGLPKEDRDERYYSDKPTKSKLNNRSVFWSAHYALVDAKLAARRNTRDFAAWSNPSPEARVKDSLSGVEECIGDELFWEVFAKKHPQLFKPASHRYGAMNLIKRLWCRTDKVSYLGDKLGLVDKEIRQALRFDSVPDIAAQNPKSKITNISNPYVAVLALDGDEMGKWVSGAKMPAFLDQLSAKAQAYLEPILKAKGKTAIHRLLTPSYHLQFSEALANFATQVASAVVESHGGQLIYAGGDDVLALLPATRAIACAEALRNAFRQPFDGHRILPGPKADVSVGIAVGHQNAPLQMLVREAQKAEKRAKQVYDHSALAVSLYKRSGEIIEWGCKWDNGKDRVALKLMHTLTELTDSEELSGRFPYALAGLLKPYALHGPRPDMAEVIRREFRYVLSRQGSPEAEVLTTPADAYLAQTANRMEDFIGLFMTETFINRSRGED